MEKYTQQIVICEVSALRMVSLLLRVRRRFKCFDCAKTTIVDYISCSKQITAFTYYSSGTHSHEHSHPHSNQCHRNDSFVLEIMQNCHLIIIACAIHLARCKMFNSSVKSFRFVSLQFTAFGSIGLIAGKRCQNRYDLRMSAHA